MRCTFDRRSGGLIRKPSAVVILRSFGISPSRISPSLNLIRTHSPSDRGLVVNVFLERESESPNSRTKNTHLMSATSIATTFPVVLSNSSFPSRTKCAGATYPFTVSRSTFGTITFLWVEGMKASDHQVISGPNVGQLTAGDPDRPSVLSPPLLPPN